MEASSSKLGNAKKHEDRLGRLCHCVGILPVRVRPMGRSQPGGRPIKHFCHLTVARLGTRSHLFFQAYSSIQTMSGLLPQRAHHYETGHAPVVEQRLWLAAASSHRSEADTSGAGLSHGKPSPVCRLPATRSRWTAFAKPVTRCITPWVVAEWVRTLMPS